MRLSVLASVLIVVLAGCGGAPPQPDTASPTQTTDGGETTYVLFTSTAEAPPENATVVRYNDSRLDGDELVKQYVERTVDEGGVSERFGKERHAELEAELSDLPRHDGSGFGYYVSYRGEIVRLRLIVEE
jgi:hypothetical protein